MKKEAKKSAPPLPPRTPFKRGAQTCKQRGELAEIAFLHKAANLGFGVAKPYGDSERYDFILDSGERLWRVQVKSVAAIYLPAATDIAPPLATAAAATKICITPPTKLISSSPTLSREMSGT